MPIPSLPDLLPWATAHWPLLLGVLLALIVLSQSFTIARGDQIIMLERRWFGRQMPDGRTVALRSEVGVQARVLGPGVHLLIPFIYRMSKRNFCIIHKNMVGVVRAITGAPIPSGSFMARPVVCDLFQDGEAFLGRDRHTHYFIFRRKGGVKSDLKAGLRTSRCPSCGAPPESADSAACAYCGHAFNDGSVSWVLCGIVPFGEWQRPSVS